MLALVDGLPKVMGLKTMLKEFLSFRREIVIKRTQYELKEAQKNKLWITKKDKEEELRKLKRKLLGGEEPVDPITEVEWEKLEDIENSTKW